MPSPLPLNRQQRRQQARLAQRRAAPGPAAATGGLKQVFAEAVALHRAGRLGEAELLYGRVLAAQPDAAPALGLSGALAHQRGEQAKALALLDRAVAIDPSIADFHNNRGLALAALDRVDEAIAAYRRALALDAGYVDAHNNLGIALSRLGRWEEAAACYRAALALNPSLAAGHLNLGNYLREAGRLDEAIDSYRRAIELDPGQTGARVLLVTALWEAARWEDARGALDALDARLSAAAGARLDFASGAALAFFLPYIAESHPLHPQILRSQSAGHAAAAPRLAPLPPPDDGGRRLRIGYLSPDFGDHAIAHVVRPIFALHDRDAFAISCFSLLDRAHNPGPYLADIKAAADDFVDLSRQSDEAAAAAIRAAGIDILVDLSGYMRGGRPRIAAARPAPLQAYWLGHGGGLAAPWIDYIIGDPTVTPQDRDGDYLEKVCRLPDIFCPADRHAISDAPVARGEFGLPEDGFVFCAFNNPTKISPEAFAIWMRLLASVPGSVLWLTSSRTDAALRARAAALGVAPERLVFAGRVEDKRVHLARYRLADLFLDTFTFNAATTALDALWAGVPMVSRLGTSFYSRIGASTLRSLGMDALVCADAAAYERLALTLATDAGRLQTLREQLAQRRLSAPLYDGPRFVRHLEAAFRTMWRRHAAGEAPRSFAVPALDAEGR